MNTESTSDPLRKRKDPRRETTRIALIEAAETLFGEMGIDGVSTRQIGAAIGSANNNVVAYHFGSKEKLVEAILHYRVAALELRRQELLEAAELLRSGQGAARVTDAETLIRVLWLPLFEQTNSNGQHSYARFLSALARSGWGGIRSSLRSVYRTTDEIASRLHATSPVTNPEIFGQRMRISLQIIVSSLAYIDENRSSLKISAEALFEDAINLALASLTTPAG
jgi:AcrR family transcriptional regulator